MPEADFGAGEMPQAQEVVDMTFPARDETTRVVEPREEPFGHTLTAEFTEREEATRTEEGFLLVPAGAGDGAGFGMLG